MVIKVEEVLTEALSVNDKFAPLHYAMGLSLVRQQDYDRALDYFKNANALLPEDGQIAMVYAIALNTLERSEEAIILLND